MFLTLFKAGRGRDRFFAIHDLQKDLFYKYTIEIYSGNVGGSIQERHYAFDSREEKDAVVRALFKQKVKEGYKVIYEYPKELEGELTRDTA